MNTSTQRKLLVIDGHSWMHRAFHAIANALTAPDGQPTNAVFGFFSMLKKTVEALAPDGVVVAFDAGKPAFRTQALAQYKMQRPPQDPNLESQFPLAKELLAAMHVPVVCLQGWEGDDLLGTLSVRGEEAGLSVFLATGDRDAYQLVTEHTSVVSSKHGSSEPVIITPPDVKARYGVTPAQVIDFLGLKGDASDNIPGVPGIGEKTAAKLLAEYKTLDAVLEAAKAGKISGRPGVNLVEHADAARASRIVATIVCDVELNPSLDLASVTFGNFEAADISETFLRYGLRSPLGWMLRFARGGQGEQGEQGERASSAHPDKISGSTLAADTMLSAADGLQSLVGISTAHTDLPQDPTIPSPYTGVVVERSCDTLFDTEQLLITSDGTDAPAIVTKATSIAAPLAELLCGQSPLATLDLKALIEQAAPCDTSLPAAFAPAALDVGSHFDLSLAAYLLASNKANYSLRFLALEHLGVDLDEVVAADRPLEEARLTARLAPVLKTRLQADDSFNLYRSIDLPLVPVLAQIERNGITIDRERLADLATYGRTQIDILRAEVFTLAGEEFNLDSPKQLAEVLFDHLQLPVIKKTQTSRSTDVSVLKELKNHHPIAEKIIAYREYTKLQNTYLEALPKLIAADERIHTSFNQTVTATGRLSSSNPNLQNIPVRTELGRRIREAFVPTDGWLLLSADYSQIELRVLADLSGDEGLIEAFTSGEDFHAQTAARIFGQQEVQGGEKEASIHTIDLSQQRSRAKAVNFGIVYGQGPHGLGQSLDIPFAEAKEMIDRYYATFPRVKSYLEETVALATKQGWIATLFGRKRHIPELASSNQRLRAFGERTAMNHPMQGTAADLIKLAMIRVTRRLQEEKLQARMLLQVHDELVFELPCEEVECLSRLVTEAMTQVAEFKVPLEVHIATGTTWSAAK